MVVSILVGVRQLYCRLKQLAAIIHAALEKQHDFQGHPFSFGRAAGDFYCATGVLENSFQGSKFVGINDPVSASVWHLHAPANQKSMIAQVQSTRESFLYQDNLKNITLRRLWGLDRRSSKADYRSRLPRPFVASVSGTWPGYRRAGGRL
jgi:hypothetical protein